jgi:hypothetical protein
VDPSDVVLEGTADWRSAEEPIHVGQARGRGQSGKQRQFVAEEEEPQRDSGEQLALYEANRGCKPGIRPVAEMRKGQTFEIRFWAKRRDGSRERPHRGGQTRMMLMEEWLAREVARLDPRGDRRFCIFVSRSERQAALK